MVEFSEQITNPPLPTSFGTLPMKTPTCVTDVPNITMICQGASSGEIRPDCRCPEGGRIKCLASNILDRVHARRKRGILVNYACGSNIRAYLSCA